MGFCMTDPEPMTDGTWNMRALAVAPAHQGAGAGGGAAIVAATEGAVAGMQGRLLIVDTSRIEAFVGARQFYLRCGYAEEARIRDVWGAGDDKVTFRKAL